MSTSMLLRWSVSLLVLAATLLAGTAPVPAQEVEREMRVSDVSSITLPIRNYPGPEIGIQTSPSPALMMDSEMSEPEFSGETLVEMIRRNVSEDSWENDRNSITYENGTLLVVQTPEVHERIGQFLATVRQARNRVISIDCTILTADASAVADLTKRGAAPGQYALLDEAGTRALLDAATPGGKVSIAKATRLTAFNGQRVHVADLRQVAFVQDYDVEIATGSAIADPVIGRCLEGVVADLWPRVDASGKTFSIEVRLSGVSLVRPIATFEPNTPSLGLLQLPVVDAQETKTTVVVPAGRTAVVCGASFAGAGATGEQIAIALLRPSLVDLGVAAAPFATKEKRELRLINVSGIIGSIPDFEGPDPQWEEDGGTAIGAALVTFNESSYPQGLVVSAESLTEIIRRNIAPDSWDDEKNRIELIGRFLAIQHTPDVLNQIQDYLTKMESQTWRMITVEARFLAIDDTLLRELGGGMGGKEAALLTADRTKSLLAAARAGEHAQLLAYGEVTGHNRQKVTVSRLRSTAYVMDYDVQIAQQSSIADPVIGHVLEGVVLNATPILAGDNRHIIVELAPTLAQLESPIPTLPTNAEKIGSLQLPTVDLQRVRTTLLVPDGGTALMGFSTRPEGDASGRRHIVLLVKATLTVVP